MLAFKKDETKKIIFLTMGVLNAGDAPGTFTCENSFLLEVKQRSDGFVEKPTVKKGTIMITDYSKSMLTKMSIHENDFPLKKLPFDLYYIK